MIERVARAIYEVEFAGDGNDGHFWKKYADDYRKQARGAIAAMREPTDAMLNSHCDRPGGWSIAGKAHFRLEWQSMIDEALK